MWVWGTSPFFQQKLNWKLDYKYKKFYSQILIQNLTVQDEDKH